MTGASAPRGGSCRAATSPAASRIQAVEAGELAWLTALPCALLTVAIVALLGPPLGHAFLGPGREAFWARVEPRPEPAEHGRYLLALLGPVLLAAAVAVAARRMPALRPASSRRAMVATQLVLVAFVTVCLLAQHNVLFSADRPLAEHTEYFTWRTLAIALALPPLALLAVRSRRMAAWLRSGLRETRARRVACLALALAFTAAWLLTAVDADRSIGNTHAGVGGHLLWSMGETFAILDGRTPLVDFHSQYGQLWPYLTAAALALIGTSIGVYTVVMTSASGLALLAVYGILRRIVQRSLLALALFAPFVATGFFMKLGPLDDRYGPANLFSLWPVRYGGAYLLAWLLARHVDGARPRRAWPLFLVGGVVVLNNPEFGAPALAATLLGLACVRPPSSPLATARLVGGAAAGVLAAAALLSVVTLIRAGSLPHLGLLLEFSRLYGIGGWAMVPLPRVGLYFAVYLTYVAAIAVAVVRIVRGEEDRTLTAMLLWSGAFGLLTGSYFAGRSHPQVLIDLFSPWALSLALLTVVAVRALAAGGWRRQALPELTVLFGFALMACSLAQTPTPWSQIRRIGDTTPQPAFRQPQAMRFVAADARRGEHVLILNPLGHRIAYDLGLVNVSPYASIESMPTLQQLQRTIAALRAAHGRKLFLSKRFTFDEELQALAGEGFTVRRRQASPTDDALLELVDRGPRRSG